MRGSRRTYLLPSPQKHAKTQRPDRRAELAVAHYFLDSGSDSMAAKIHSSTIAPAEAVLLPQRNADGLPVIAMTEDQKYRFDVKGWLRRAGDTVILSSCARTSFPTVPMLTSRQI